MPIGILYVRLRDKKDHFVFTIYKKDRDRFRVTLDSVLLLEINGKKLFRIPNRDFHITVPKKLLRANIKITKVQIIKIYSKLLAKARDKELFQDCNVNLGAFISPKTIFGKEILVFDCGRHIYVWYSLGGGAKHIMIKKIVNAERLAELIGFYFGDGNTSENIRSFRLNNCESSTMVYCLDILNDLGISRDLIKLQVIYSSNKNIEDKIKIRCINYWSKTLNIKKSQVVSVVRSKSMSESLTYGSARIIFDSSVFVEVMLHGLLKSFVSIVKNPKSAVEKTILKGFMCGLAAAEGCVYLRKQSLSRISLSFNQKTDDLNFYKRLLDNLGITYGKHKRNELFIYGIENFKILNSIDIFKMHNKRRYKFVKGFANHR